MINQDTLRPSGESPAASSHYYLAPWSTIVLLLTIIVAGAPLALATAPWPDEIDAIWRDVRRGGLPYALATMGLGGLVYCLLPALWPREASATRQLYGSHRAVLQDLVACLLLMAPIGAGGIWAWTQLTGVPFAQTEAGQLRLRPEGILVGSLLTAAPTLIVVWGRVIGSGAAAWSDLGLRWPTWRDVTRGVVSGAFILIATAITGALLRFNGLVGDPMRQFTLDAPNADGLALALIGGSIVAPLVEEIFFRGYIFGAYLKRKGWVVSYLFSATMFAVLHLNVTARGGDANLAAASLAVFLPIFVAGLVLARLYHASGSLAPGIIAHGVNNAAAFAVFFAIGLGNR